MEENLFGPGGFRVFLSTKSPYFDAEGRVIGIIGVSRDITERKRAETALRKSEERFQLSMEATSDGLWDWDIRTDGAYYSPGYSRMLGYEPGDFHLQGESWKNLIHPDDREHAVRVNTDCIEGRRASFEVEFRMKAKNGEWRWILGRGKCVARDADGRALRLVGTHVDITERKRAEDAVQESERRLRTVLETVSLVGIMLDRQANITLCNDYLLALTGWKREEV